MSFNKLNTYTSMEEIKFRSEWVDLNSILDSTTFKVLHGIGSFLAMSIAYFCYLGFIHYEYYEGDPMKRWKWYIKKVSILKKFHQLLQFNFTVSVQSSLSIFASKVSSLNAKILILSYKISILAFTKILLEMIVTKIMT